MKMTTAESNPDMAPLTQQTCCCHLDTVTGDKQDTKDANDSSLCSGPVSKCANNMLN